MTTLLVAPATIAAVLLFQLTASAATEPLEGMPTPESEVTVQAARPVKPAALPTIGLMTDAGIPDGLTGALVYRPARWLRLHGGGSYNMISGGVRAGATLIPFGFGPSLSVEGGHYFEGNANGLVARFAGSGYSSNAVLERVGYDYANLHLGLDFGVRRATFYIHGGMSYLRTTVHHVNDVIQSSSDANSSTQVSVNQDPVIRAFTPSIKLGLIVYLW
jgi:hypothetical protein